MLRLMKWKRPQWSAVAMTFDEATLQRRWKATIAICLGYAAVLAVLLGLIVFDAKVVGWLADTSQANIDRATHQSKPTDVDGTHLRK